MVELVEHLGGETFAYARCGSSDLLTLATNNSRGIAAGDEWQARFDPGVVLVFDESGERIR